jgi:amidophosphoribosyltransferase
MATREELVANRLDAGRMAAHVGADSLHYLSLDGLLQAVRGSRGDHCLACFTGEYPVEVRHQLLAAHPSAPGPIAPLLIVGSGGRGV